MLQYELDTGKNVNPAELVEKLDRVSKIREVVRSYVVFCITHDIITAEEYLYILSFLNGGDDTFIFILQDVDRIKYRKEISRGLLKVVDLTEAVRKMSKHKHYFDWGKLDYYEQYGTKEAEKGH